MKKLRNSHYVGILVIMTVAFLWHDIYKSISTWWMAALAPVNESPWEHVKLFFMPSIIYFVLEYLYIGKTYGRYLFSRAMALLLMPLIMLIQFYGYRFILQSGSILWLDILISLTTIALGLWIGYRILVRRSVLNHKLLAMSMILLQLAVFAFLTFMPPEWPIFYDHHFSGYGIGP